MIALADIAPRRALNAETKRNEGEHALIFGITGFGKTYLVQRLAQLRSYVAVHDAKGTFASKGMTRFTSLRKLVRTKATHIIYAPDRNELRDDGAQNAFFEWIYRRGNTTLIVDELTAVATSRHDIPDSLFDLYSRGREFGDEVWALTQEPTFVPSIAITQARHRYTFYVAGDAHQKRVCAVMPGLTVANILDLNQRQFYYYREGTKTIDSRGPFKLGSSVT